MPSLILKDMAAGCSLPSMENRVKPTLAVSMGDPAGIGPEIILKALRKPNFRDRGNLVVVGVPEVFEECARRIGWKGKIRGVKSLVEADFTRKEIQILEAGVDRPIEFEPGKVSASAGAVALKSIEKGAELCLDGSCEGLVTAPIHKVAIRAAGSKVPGHTEILQQIAGGEDPLTLFIAGPLRIFFFSRHLSLANAVRAIKTEPLLVFLRRVHEAMGQLGKSKARIGVAALNPHGGDDGLMGSEEPDEIIPAIELARKEGIDAVGPIPADSIFGMVVTGDAEVPLDCQVALYHDQGHIAAKTYDFHGTVSATLGLPFTRTSVDHGTAFDIAWQGKASEKSMAGAIEAAFDLIEARRKSEADPHRAHASEK